jgi:hypothetical protein
MPATGRRAKIVQTFPGKRLQGALLAEQKNPRPRRRVIAAAVR